MTTLGVTGGIGSGKSAFVARLARHPGVRVLLADDLAKRLMADDADVRRQLVARFGAETFGPDGALDRAYLAGRVFGDPRRARGPSTPSSTRPCAARSRRPSSGPGPTG